MTNQGLRGALEQYWTVEDKPRLHRRNTYFEDHPKVTNQDALRIGIIATIVCITIVIFSMIGGI